MFSIPKSCIFAPAIERKLLLYRKSGLIDELTLVFIDDRRQSSMMTKIRARNGGQAKSRINQTRKEGKNPDEADLNLVKTEKKNAFAVSFLSYK